MFPGSDSCIEVRVPTLFDRYNEWEEWKEADQSDEEGSEDATTSEEETDASGEDNEYVGEDLRVKPSY